MAWAYELSFGSAKLMPIGPSAEVVENKEDFSTPQGGGARAMARIAYKWRIFAEYLGDEKSNGPTPGGAGPPLSALFVYSAGVATA